MKIIYSKRFDKSFGKLDSKKQEKIIETIAIFQNNPQNIVLKNHKLLGNKKGLRSISAGGYFRIIFLEEDRYTQVIMIKAGSHNHVY